MTGDAVPAATGRTRGPDHADAARAGAPVGRVLRRAGGYGVATLAQAAAGLLVLPIATRLLGPADLGAVALAVLVTQVIWSGAVLGLPVSVTLFATGPEGSSRAGRLAVGGVVCTTALTAAAHLTGPWWADAFSSLGYGPALRTAVWTALPVGVLGIAQALLRVHAQVRAFVAAALCSTVGGQVAALGLVAAVGGAPAYLAGLALGHTLGAAVSVAAARRWLAAPRLGDLRLGIRMGAPTVAHALGVLVLAVGDRWVIERVLGLEAAGSYHVAYVIGAAGIPLLGAVNNAWQPAVLAAGDDRRWRSADETTALLIRLTSVLAAVVALTAPVVVALLAPPSFDRAAMARVTAVVGIAAVAYCCYLSRGVVLLHVRATGVLGLMTPTAAVANVALNLLLVPRAGVTGAAVATVLTYTGWAVWTAAAARRHVRLRAVPAAPIAGAVVALALGLLLPTGGWGGVIRGVAAGVAILGGGAALRRALSGRPAQRATAA